MLFTSSQLNQDLDLCVNFITNTHPNLYFKTSKQLLETEIDTLRGNLNNNDITHFSLRLKSILTLIGDSHTNIVNLLQLSHFHSLPIRIRWMNKGIYLLGVPKVQSNLLGAELISINNIDIAEIIKRISTIIPHENESILYSQIDILEFIEVLEYLKIASTDNALTLGLKLRDGNAAIQQVDQTLTELGYIDELQSKPLFLSMRKIPQYYAVELFDNYLYFRYDRCQIDPNVPLEAVQQKILNYLESGTYHNKRVTIDLRRNPGGNSGIMSPFFKQLVKHKQSAKFAVLTSIKTHSSAVIHALECKYLLGATIVGEPTSGPTESYGDIKSFTLPNSKLEVICSTRIVRRGADYLPAANTVTPDIYSSQTIEDLIAGKDTILEKALEVLSLD